MYPISEQKKELIEIGFKSGDVYEVLAPNYPIEKSGQHFLWIVHSGTEHFEEGSKRTSSEKMRRIRLG